MPMKLFSALELQVDTNGDIDDEVVHRLCNLAHASK